MCQAQYEQDFNVEGEMLFICHVYIDEKYNLNRSQEVGQDVGQEIADLDAEVYLTNGANNEVDQEIEAG